MHALRAGDQTLAADLLIPSAMVLGSGAAVWQSFGDFQLHASDIEDPLITELRLELAGGSGAASAPAASQAAEVRRDSLGEKPYCLTRGCYRASARQRRHI